MMYVFQTWFIYYNSKLMVCVLLRANYSKWRCNNNKSGKSENKTKKNACRRLFFLNQ